MNELNLSEKQRFDALLDGIEHLPSAPVHMIRLIKLFQEPERDVDEVISLLKKDPPLAAEILRRCNSSFFGNDEPVTNITEALFRLGFYEVYRLTVSLFGMKAVTETKTGTDLGIEAIWRHSTMTAIIGGSIGRELEENEGTVFTAGLLHDIGKIILALAAGPNYTALIKKHGYFGPELNQAESSEFGFNHAEVGAWLLRRWEVPELITEPVFQCHRNKWEGPFGRVAAILNLANLMAHSIESPATRQLFETPDGIPSMRLLGLTSEDMQRLEDLARADLKRSNLNST